MKFDYVIVGAGLTGATLARLLNDAGRTVIVLERRPYVGGNCADFMHPAGVMVNRNGPHYFRTSSEKIWDFVNRFGSWRPFAAEVRAAIGDHYERWPVSRGWIAEHCPEPARSGTPQMETLPLPKNFEEAALHLMPQLAYDTFVAGYTRKQWGCDPKELAAELASRLEVREGSARPLKLATYQAVPVLGYSELVSSMLSGIKVETRIDYLLARENFLAERKIIFTGPIDQFFDFKLGRLRYRGQRREHAVHPLYFRHPTVQTNYPDLRDGDFVREIEWKHMTRLGDAVRNARETLITREYPQDATDPEEFEYPYPDRANATLYREYLDWADRKCPGVMFCGRLGRYKYFDMDQAIGAAMVTAERLLAGE
jgi:UDP-galactopyranose mutase